MAKLMVYGIAFLLSSFLIPAYTHAYVMGMKSADNSVENLKQVERLIGEDIHLVSFILDPFLGERTLRKYHKDVAYLSGKVLHVTIAPNVLNAQEVAQWAFDKPYTAFFEFVKKNNLKVIFRTMHEMNGNRYPRSGDPYQFKNAWLRVRHLSRKAGLDTQNIVFDFSVNHRDVSWTGSVRCTLANKHELGCKTWEDYRPGNTYVDVIGFTFYNRGKATSNRRRLWPEEIIVDDGANLLERMRAYGKPLMIDEVGTTAINYTDGYERQRSVDMFFSTEGTAKNLWLQRLAGLIRTMPDIAGMVYFNVDYTAGLKYELPNEADWLIVNTREKKYREGIQSLFSNQQHKNTLDALFVSPVSKSWIIKKKKSTISSQKIR